MRETDQIFRGLQNLHRAMVSIGEKELFEDVSTGLSVDEDNDEYDFDDAFKTAAAKQLKNMTDAPFADYDIDVSDESPSSYQPTEDDEPVLDAGCTKLLFEVSEYIGNQSDQPKVAALAIVHAKGFKRTNRPTAVSTTKILRPESGKFVSSRTSLKRRG